MTDRNTGEPAWMSRSDIARGAGVGRAAVSNWESRNSDFPRPVRMDGREVFDPHAVVTWLTGRRIPANALAEGEQEGLDYGSRLRRDLGWDARAVETLVDFRYVLPTFQVVMDPSTPGDHAAEWLFRQLRAVPSPTAHLWLVFLVYVCELHPQTWSFLRGCANDWQTFARIWRDLGAGDPVLRDVPPPDVPVQDIAVDRAWSPGHIVAIVENAHAMAGGGFGAADLFGRLLERYARAQGRRAGQLITPQSVAGLATKALVDVVVHEPRVFDPFCRAGELLSAVVSELSNRGDRPGLLAGHHPDATLLLLSRMNLRLHGVEPQISGHYWWDARDARDVRDDRRFDLVISNPPFNMRVPEDLVHREPWYYGPPPLHSGNFAWLQHVISRLDRAGRAAVVMSNNAGFTNNPREVGIRAAMIEDGVVECVIALPSHLFPGTAVRVSLWLLRAPAGRPSDVLFIDATDAGTGLVRAVRTLRPDAVERILDDLQRWRGGVPIDEPGFSRSVSVTALREKNYALNPSSHVKESPSVGDPDADFDRVADLLGENTELHERIRPIQEEARELRRAAAAFDANTVPLGDLCDLRVGLAGHRLRNGSQQPDGVPVLLPRLLRDGRIVGRPSQRILLERVPSQDSYLLQENDLVISRTVERGRVARISAEQSGWVLSTGLIRLRIRDARVTPGYLAQYLLSEAAHSWVTRHMVGTTVPSITLKALAGLPVPVVTPAEQDRWSAALDAVTEQERLHEQIAANIRSVREILNRSIFTTREP